ncbi:MAG: ABC transporter permease [Erysipelotrichaceae bacterium]|nr:ABC transporter permease [Erysipelotrichaceae bacterium]
MTVFKTYCKVLTKCKWPILLYTVILIFFSAFNTQNNDTSTMFSATRPKIHIINLDENSDVSKHFITYLNDHSDIIDFDSEEAVSDALFYHKISCVITIPKNFGEDFYQGKDVHIDIKSTKDYQGSLIEMMLERYVKVATAYVSIFDDHHDLFQAIDQTLATEVETSIASSLDSDSLNKAALYFNFSNYCLVAGCVFVICMILTSFMSDHIRKRTIISSLNYKKYNRQLLLSNGVFTFVLWLFYIVLSILLVGNAMFTLHGLLYMLNSFVFAFCSLCLAFLIANLVKNKEAINGIVNVLALGSSFLCGAFVPMEMLPEGVLKAAHVLPSYWFIKNNETLKTLETLNTDTLQPIFINMLVIFAFSCLFIIISNIIAKKKRKIN